MQSFGRMNDPWCGGEKRGSLRGDRASIVVVGGCRNFVPRKDAPALLCRLLDGNDKNFHGWISIKRVEVRLCWRLRRS